MLQGWIKGTRGDGWVAGTPHGGVELCPGKELGCAKMHAHSPAPAPGAALALGERAEQKRHLMSGTPALQPRESEGSNYRSLTQGKNVLEGMQGEAVASAAGHLGQRDEKISLSGNPAR